MTLKRTLIAAGAAVVLLAAATPAAHASQLIDRNATGVKLQVNARQALLTYRAAGVAKHVVASGAVNALPPSHGRPQVKFTLDYSGRGFSGGGCRPCSTAWPSSRSSSATSSPASTTSRRSPAWRRARRPRAGAPTTRGSRTTPRAKRSRWR